MKDKIIENKQRKYSVKYWGKYTQLVSKTLKYWPQYEAQRSTNENTK